MSLLKSPIKIQSNEELISVTKSNWLLIREIVMNQILMSKKFCQHSKGPWTTNRPETIDVKKERLLASYEATVYLDWIKPRFTTRKRPGFEIVNQLSDTERENDHLHIYTLRKRPVLTFNALTRGVLHYCWAEIMQLQTSINLSVNQNWSGPVKKYLTTCEKRN